MASLTFVFLLIEFFDEFVYAVGGTARPSLRADLGLSYAQIGILLGLPAALNTLFEPALMLLGDTRWRKLLVIGGGLGMALSAALVAGAQGRSGTMKAVQSLGGLAGGAIAGLIGWLAGMAGLQTAMWLLLLGPVSLAVFVPRPATRKQVIK